MVVLTSPCEWSLAHSIAHLILAMNTTFITRRFSVAANVNNNDNNNSYTGTMFYCADIKSNNSENSPGISDVKYRIAPTRH